MKKLLLLSLSIIISSCASGLQLVDKAPYVIGYSSKDKIETLNCLRTFDKAKVGILKISAKIPFTNITTDDGNGFALLGNDYVYFKIQPIDEEKFKSKISVHATYKIDAVSSSPIQYVNGCSEIVEVL
ncbi:hypothetical protein N9N99_02330 [Gammaproteobacteria bacterium]|nr:hypothetical protein [Gammaproteobacteria bacterium]